MDSPTQDRRMRVGEPLMSRITGRRSARALTVVALLFFAGLPVGAQGKSGEPARDWEKAAGGKQQFEVASVRKDAVEGRSTSNVDLDGASNLYWQMSKDDVPAADAGLLNAKYVPLTRLIIFAYRLNGTQELALRMDYFKGLEMHVPDWVRKDQYDVEARTPGPATKDQMRLMMQSLLEDRFKLKVHWETRQAPVFDLVEVKPGVLGPQIEPHPASDDCTATKFSDSKNAPAPQLSALPVACGWIGRLATSQPGENHFGGRGVPLSMLASSLPAQTGLATIGKPVVDKTGLTGNYDFQLDWVREISDDMNNSEGGGSFRDALRKQLGLKLVPDLGPVEVLVIDHVEQPTEN